MVMVKAARPRVVIVGGGFAGIQCAEALASAAVDLTLIDRKNHHLFQPLLYQVATAALSPSQIAAPIREVLRGQRNCRVLMADVTGVDPEQREVRTDGAGVLAYDYLVLATGVSHSYFGNESWQAQAPGLKTLEDALDIRRRFLLCFELAERATDPAERAALLTFVVVGGGPTGVEMAGAMVEIALQTIRDEFRSIDTGQARVILVEAQPRVLAGFDPALSESAKRTLRAMGVDVRTNTRVTAIDGTGVMLTHAPEGDPGALAGGGAPVPSSEFIASRHVIWAAGVAASALGAMTGGATDRAGRVVVEPDLSVAGRKEVFVLGDMASVMDRNGLPVPGMAPGAMQMGRHAGATIARDARALDRGEALPARRAFRYVDKGQLATIGRARAVAHVFGRNVTGLPAWLLWAGVHVVYLIDFRSKVLVLMEWFFSYIFFRRGARLITGDARTAQLET